MLTPGELRYCNELASRLERVRNHLNATPIHASQEPVALFNMLATFRELQGNLSNDVSFAATLLAKAYLYNKFGLTFDAAEKPQGAPGIDIDVNTPKGERVVGEIKTTVPYQANDFGAQQAKSFKADFAKLATVIAQHKFLFVTDSRSYKVLLKPKYLSQIPGVTIVNLTTGDEFNA